MLGDENGHVPLTMEKEIYPTENTKGILGSDDFNGEKLSLLIGMESQSGG